VEAEAAERQQRYQQRVEELAAAARARGQQLRSHIKPRPRDEAPNPKAAANVTDPDSRFLSTRKGSVQGYNAQAVVTEQQVVIAAELTQDANDVQQLAPMLQAVDQTLAAAEGPDRLGMLLADSGYWSIANLTSIPDAPELLVWPSKTGRTGKPRNGVPLPILATTHPPPLQCRSIWPAPPPARWPCCPRCSPPARPQPSCGSGATSSIRRSPAANWARSASAAASASPDTPCWTCSPPPAR